MKTLLRITWLATSAAFTLALVALVLSLPATLPAAAPPRRRRNPCPRSDTDGGCLPLSPHAPALALPT
ncbi:MAG: hypothetical protein U0768_18580 [Anaerolineae bacterium]